MYCFIEKTSPYSELFCTADYIKTQKHFRHTVKLSLYTKEVIIVDPVQPVQFCKTLMFHVLRWSSKGVKVTFSRFKSLLDQSGAEIKTITSTNR